MPPPQFADYGPSSSERLFYKSVFHIPAHWQTTDRERVARKSMKHPMVLGCSVQAIFSQEAVEGNAGWRIDNDVNETDLDRVWTGGQNGVENSRLQMRLMGGCSAEFLCDEAKFHDSDWEITVDMWATSITRDKIHLRTLIDVRKDGLDMWGGEWGGVVTKYFTPTEQEISLNTGGQSFHFTCIVQSTADSTRRDLKLLT